MKIGNKLVYNYVANAPAGPEMPIWLRVAHTPYICMEEVIILLLNI